MELPPFVIEKIVQTGLDLKGDTAQGVLINISAKNLQMESATKRIQVRLVKQS